MTSLSPSPNKIEKEKERRNKGERKKMSILIPNLQQLVWLVVLEPECVLGWEAARQARVAVLDHFQHRLLVASSETRQRKSNETQRKPTTKVT
jgi:hypothetical protein